ncbi:MAG: N-acetyl-gamma-glutamyl-phosphate reductase [Candidatus Jordarchaeaceae archaeon]
MRVGIVGASGYTGGELTRLLLFHPDAELTCVTSRQFSGKYLSSVHPNLRGITQIKFVDYNVNTITDKCDYIFLAVPHRASMGIMPELLETGLKIIDLSADFRIKNLETYEYYYGKHEHPELLEKSVYGISELHKEEIKKAQLVSCPGCMASSAILGAAPMVGTEAVDLNRIVIDSKVGSSASGREFSLSTHHPERANVVRPYKATGHRHTAEMEQELSAVAGKQVKVAFSAHAVDMVRGILTTIHLFLEKTLSEQEVCGIFREFYADEPFIRIIKQKTGIYRLPDPKTVGGTNYCDIGFEIDEHMPRIVVFSALDNLIKGAAGQAVQCMNIMEGIDETRGLTFPGFHPY